jgi:hypothetical protein
VLVRVVRVNGRSGRSLLYSAKTSKSKSPPKNQQYDLGDNTFQTLRHRLDSPLLVILICFPVGIRACFREQFGVVDPKAAG